MKHELSSDERIELENLATDPYLTRETRQIALKAMNYISELEYERAWRNPYTEAIAVLESRARAFEGGFG